MRLQLAFPVCLRQSLIERFSVFPQEAGYSRAATRDGRSNNSNNKRHEYRAGVSPLHSDAVQFSSCADSFEADKRAGAFSTAGTGFSERTRRSVSQSPTGKCFNTATFQRTGAANYSQPTDSARASTDSATARGAGTDNGFFRRSNSTTVMACSCIQALDNP